MLETQYKTACLQIAQEYFKTNNISYTIADLTAKADELYLYITTAA